MEPADELERRIDGAVVGRQASRESAVIARKHDRQLVTGLVVNQKVNLPRSTRRRLRAIEHHLKTGKPATLTPQQLSGWRALQSMVATQSES